MRWMKAFATAVGAVVITLWLAGAVLPGLDFRLCFGSAGRCFVLFEAGAMVQPSNAPSCGPSGPSSPPREFPGFEQSIAQATK